MSQIARGKALNSNDLQENIDVEIKDKLVYLFFKRSMDIIGASLGIILLLCVFLIVAVAIKVEDPKGKIFFTQKRIGINGKEFYMYKFRSMIVDAEERLKELLEHNETTGAMFKMKDDPRVTRIGKFIRKTSIDELPQLWNVLKGEMSLVGPRPPLDREVSEYNSYHMQRLLVKPGCTGLWQISGRSNLGFEEMVKLDLLYIKKRTIFFDIKIVLKTFSSLLNSKGAY